MRYLNQNERKEYGKMLLDVADIGIQYKNQVLSMTLIENKKNLKERLFSIIQYKRSAKWMTIFSALILCLLCMSTLTVGGMTLEIHKNKGNEISEQKTEDTAKNIQDSNSIESKLKEETDSDTFLDEESYLKGSVLENIIIDSLIKGAELSDSDLYSILPFVGDDFSDMLIEIVKSGMNFSMSQLVIMAPFITEECVDEIIYGEMEQQIEIEKEDLYTLLPYASENALELLLQAVLKNGYSMDLQDLMTIAPFLDSDMLGQCVAEYMTAGEIFSKESITHLACYLEEDVLGEIMRFKLDESPQEVLMLLQDVAYAMDSSDMKEILVEIMNLGIELEIYNVESYYPFLDDNDLRDIIEVMRKKNFATQKEVERFYKQYDL